MSCISDLQKAFVLTAALAATHLVSAAGDESGFHSLLNGRDLTGWVNVNCAPETWRWVGNVVACTGTPTGVLRTERMYQNFILELEWRHLKPKGNAGVFVWADPHPSRGVPFVRGIEVQVLDGQEGSWFTSDGDIFPIHGAKMTPENGRGGDRAFPTEKRQKLSPEWNSYRVECIDGAIALAVNGKIVTRGHNASPRKGYICLESEGSPVEFRNIRIKELPSQSALEPEHIASTKEGYRPLYNGLDLRGWTTTTETPKSWKSADWILDGTSSTGAEDDVLWTTGQFGDYQLIVDWRWNVKPEEKDTSTTDSQSSSSEETRTNPRPAAIAMRLVDGKPGATIEMNSDGSINTRHEDKSSSTPLSTQNSSGPASASKPRGEWNRFLITLRGNQYSVTLNGQPHFVSAQLPGIPARGAIGLILGDEPIQFANILVRELD